MATTLQELQDKRKELQITNPNATMLDAKSALSPSPITNAPVAWQAPAITPIVPEPVAPAPIDNKQVLANNQAKVQWEIQAWTRPAVWTQPVAQPIAPVSSNPISTPSNVDVRTPWTTTPSWATMNPDWTVTQSSNPISTTPSISNKPTKKEVVETPRPATIGDMYNNLVNRIDVPPEQKALPTYKIAQNRFNKANMFSSMTPAELSTEMKSAKLVEWSPAWEDLKVMNPELVRSTKALNTANGIKPEIFTYINNPDGTKVKQNNLEQSFVSDYNDNYSDIVKILTNIYKPDTAAEARAKIYTPEVRQAEEKATAIELEMNALSDDMKKIDKDIESSYEWTWATWTTIRLQKQYAKERLTNDYNSLLKNYTAYANKANSLITQNTDLYNSEQEGKKALSTALAWVALKDYGMQAEADFARKEAIKNINDPATAINNVIEEYKKLGIPFTSTLQSRLQEFANSGKSLPDYLTEMTQNIQASPWYKQYAEMKAWELSDIQKMKLQAQLWEASNVADFNRQIQLAWLKWDIDRQNYLWQIENDPEKQAKALEIQEKLNNNKSLFDVLGTNVWTYEWNRGYDLAWTKWTPVVSWNGWKVIETDTAWEQVGSIFKSGKWAKPYGNTVLMEDENGNKIRYSHLDSIWVKKDDVLGFGDIIGAMGNTGNVLGKNGEKLTAEQLAQGRGSHVDVEIKDPSGKLLTNAEQVNYLKNQKKWTTDITDKQFTQYNQMYSKFTADPNVKAFESALAWGWDLIASLKSSNWPWDVGAVFWFMKSLDPQSVVKEGEFALAAKSAWVWEQFKNIPANKLEGTILTEDQRKAFWKLAFEYIKNKWKIYDIKYNDLTKVLNNQWIPKNYYPTKMTEMINMYDYQKWGWTDNVDSIMAEYNARK